MRWGQVNIVATASPFCSQMLEEGIKKKTWPGSVEAMEIANLLQNTLAKEKDDEHDCLCETGSRPGDTTEQIQD